MLNFKNLIAAALLSGVAALSFAQAPTAAPMQDTSATAPAAATTKHAAKKHHAKKHHAKKHAKKAAANASSAN